MEACAGSTHVIPVPPQMEPEAAWEEITTLGRLTPYQGEPTWAVFECPGGEECQCRGTDRAPFFRRWCNDQLVEFRVFGRQMPSPVREVYSWLISRPRLGRR